MSLKENSLAFLDEVYQHTLLYMPVTSIDSRYDWYLTNLTRLSHSWIYGMVTDLVAVAVHHYSLFDCVGLIPNFCIEDGR